MGQFSWLDCKDQSQILIGEGLYKNRPAYVLVPEPFHAEYGNRAPHSHHISENNYKGYGEFGGYDIYELAADWNREALREDCNLPDRSAEKLVGIEERYSEESMDLLKRRLAPKPELKNFGHLYDFEKDEMRKKGMTEEQIKEAEQAWREKNYNAALTGYNIRIQRLRDFLTGNLDHDGMKEKYGYDYKREVGIDIACDDSQNINLPYPIEITHDPEAVFDKNTPSLADIHQGVYYNKEREEAMERIEEALDKAGVEYDIDDYYARVEFWTGSDRTLNIHVELEYDNTPEDLVAQFTAYAQNFDAEEEASLYAEDDEISPDDCREAKTALMDLAVRLEEALGKEAACEIAETHNDTRDTECEEL